MSSKSKSETANANAASSAATASLFKEDLPKKLHLGDVFKNEHSEPMPKRKGLEYGEDNTLMGRLGARMASRDFIDQLNLGFGTKAKKAAMADTADDELDILHVPQKIFLSNALTGMGRHQQVIDMDSFNSSDPIKAGDYRDNSAIPGSNMADQAKAQGNVFGKKFEIQADAIPGGKATGLPDSMFKESSIKEGQKIEAEHSPNPAVQREIAKDHLIEHKDYYPKLKSLGL